MPLCACLGGKEKAQAVKAQPDGKKAQDDAKRSKTAGVRKKVYITRSIHEDAIALLEDKFDLTVWEFDEKVPRERFLQDITDVSAIICSFMEEINDEVLRAAGPSLKIICSMTSDLSHIDQEECRKRGIILHHVADLCADVNAELTVALLLMTSKNLIEGQEAFVNGDCKFRGYDLKNKTIGFLGFGRVGFGVAKRLEGFDVARIIYFSKKEEVYDVEPKPERVETADQIFAESDFIVCCLSLSEETKNFINRKNLSLCKPECVLVNTARAELINQDDLLACLDEGTIAGVALDVTTPEPLPPTHPLLQNPRCVITPHMGTATSATRQRMAVHLANIVLDELKGTQ